MNPTWSSRKAIYYGLELYGAHWCMCNASVMELCVTSLTDLEMRSKVGARGYHAHFTLELSLYALVIEIKFCSNAAKM